MQRLSLSQTMILAILLALLPVGVLSIWQSISVREYSQNLLRERLVHTARATAATQAIPFEFAARATGGLMHDPAVEAIGPDCSDQLAKALATGRDGPIIAFGRWTAQADLACSAPNSSAAGSAHLANLGRESFGLSDMLVRPLLKGPITGRPILLMARPVIVGGDYKGFVTASLEVDWLQNALRSQGLSSDAAAAIVGPDGRIMIGSPALSQVQFDIARGQSKAIAGQQGWIYSVAPLVNGRLFLIHAEPTSILYSGPRRQMLIDLAFPLLVVLIASLTIWLALRWRVLGWLREIGKLAERYGRGDYSRDISRFAKAPMELRSLAERFDLMAGAIEARDADLIDAADRNLSLAREVNHRVKNNLQIITSLVAMQASEVREPAAKAALELTRARIGAIGVIHKLLYDEREGDMGSIQLGDLCEALCSQLRTNMARKLLTLDCASGSGRIPLDVAVPLSLFVVQGMSDALAHARRDNQPRHVHFSLERVAQRLHIAIEHTGSALEGDLEEVEFRRTLMEIYAQQLRGELSISDKPEKVRFEIRAKLPEGDDQEA